MLLKCDMTLRASRLDCRVQEPLVDQPVSHLFNLDEDDGTFVSIRPQVFFDCR